MRTPQRNNVTQRAVLREAAQPNQTQGNAPFYITLFYLLLEFGRPQDLVPALAILRLSMLTSIVIGFLLLGSGRAHLGNIQTKCFLALLALMIVHGPFATNNFEAFMAFRQMALTFIGYLGIVSFVDSFNKIKTMAGVWIGVHLFLSILGIIKGGKGIGGFMGDENDFAVQLNMVVSFAFFALFSASSAFKKSTYIGLLCVYILTILMTLSRGGFIGLAAVGAYCWGRSSRKFLAAILVFLLVTFVVLVAPEKYWEEIASITSDRTLETGTGGERLYTWGIAWEIFLANPIVGVGQGNLPWVFDEYEQGRTFHEKSIAGRAAHSTYFTLLPELGVVGTVLFLIMVYGNWRDIGLISALYRRNNPRVGIGEQINTDLKTAYFLARGMEGSIVGYLVSSVFVSCLYYPSFWIMTGFVVALMNVVIGNRAKEGNPAQEPLHPFAGSARHSRTQAGTAPASL